MVDIYKNYIKLDIPIDITFELTHRCNLSCKYCYMPKNYYSDKKELTFEKTIEILNELADLKVMRLVFTGGDLFLNKKAIEIIKHADDLNFQIKLISNLTLAKKEQLDAISKMDNIDRITTSLYSIKREKHDWFCGMKGSYDKTIKSIRRLRKSGLPVYINYPVTNFNFREFPEYTNFFKNLGIPNYFYKFTHKWDGDPEPTKYHLNSSEVEELRELAKIKKHFNKKNEDVKKKKNGNDIYCSAAHTTALIDPYGNVYPCIDLRVFIGNLNKDSFASTWKNRKKYFKPILWKEMECFNCKFNNRCKSCPGDSNSAYGNYQKAYKPQCFFNHNMR